VLQRLYASLPESFFDPHHHFLETDKTDFHKILKDVGAPSYFPEHYKFDVQDNLNKIGVNFKGTVHVEAMPDDGYAEVQWILKAIEEDRCPYVKGIVASCDLALGDVDSKLKELKQSSDLVKGVRWVLDCVGPFEGGKTATHIGITRNRGGADDYLRGGEDGGILPSFEYGFSLLSNYGFSFDLQCAPQQLMRAAELCRKYPDIPVCIDHLGKPRTVLGKDEPGNHNLVPDAEELRVWRDGMRAMAAMPQVYVKISMLGYIVPGWIRTKEREAVLRDLVCETIDLFTPKRCMVATNWHIDEALSDAGGLSDVGPSVEELIRKFSSWFEKYTEEEKGHLFCDTAKEFYRA